MISLGFVNAVFADTSASFDFTREADSSEVVAALKKLRIPPYSGISHKFDYRIFNLRVSDFTVGSATVHNPSGVGYNLELVDADIIATADIIVEKEIRILSWRKIVRADVSAVIDFRNVYLNLGAVMYADGENVKMRSTTCVSQIEEVDIELEGKGMLGRVIAGVFNTVRGLFVGSVRDAVQAKICPAVEEELTKYMSTLNLNKLLG